VPTYQYVCTECGGQLEALQKFTDDPLTVHDACGGKLRKVFSPVGIVFKGSGFYRTDSRNGSSTAPAASAAAASADSGSASSSSSSGSSDSGSASSSGGDKSSSDSSASKPSSSASKPSTSAGKSSEKVA
jgi:putative FmdB family regulatory protein